MSGSDEWAGWAAYWAKQEELPCPNLECFSGQIDDLTRPKSCSCCSYEMIDCPTCNGEGVVPNVRRLDTAPAAPVRSSS